MGRQIKIFAHRGASGHALENSFKAFDKAILLKADGIEMDLQCSKDGKLFVFHDINLNRLTGVNRSFNDCLAKEISELRLGRSFLRLFTNTKIPSVEQFLSWLRKNPIPVNIELKETVLDHPDELITWLKGLELPNGSHFSSFIPELLQIVKQVRPDIETAILVTKKFNWDTLPALNYIDSVHASKKYYKRLYLEMAQKAEKPMRFYGIEGDEPFLRNPHPIVVGWITDYPDKVAQFISKK